MQTSANQAPELIENKRVSNLVSLRVLNHVQASSATRSGAVSHLDLQPAVRPQPCLAWLVQPHHIFAASLAKAAELFPQVVDTLAEVHLQGAAGRM